MKFGISLFAAVMLVAVCALDVEAQQGCQAGCTTATRARQNPEPTPTPENLQDVAKDTQRAEGFSPAVSFASSRRITEARPASGVNILSFGNNNGGRRGNVDDGEVRALQSDLAAAKSRVEAMNDRLTDAIARGEQLPTRAEIAAELADIDVFDMVVKDPRFEQLVKRVVASQGLILEIEPAE